MIYLVQKFKHVLFFRQDPPRKLLLVLLLPLIFSTQAQANRVALVIANSRYQQLNTLNNSLADGLAVAERLKRAGFTLLHPVRSGDVQSDLNLVEMLQADEALQQESRGAEMALLYYAGHGLQMDGVPYLVPVDVGAIQPQTLKARAGQDLLKRQLVDLDSFIAGLDQNAQVAVAVFDACREIPQLEESSRAVFGDSPFRGLARPKSEGRHRLLAYSASSGELAKDGAGRHSPYTQAWLDEFDRDSSKDILAFFNDVAAQVVDAKGQNPEVLTRGIHSATYFLAPNAKPVTSGSIEKPNPAPTVATDEDEAERLYRNKNYRQALPLLRKLAIEGNRLAQLRLGTLYEEGEVVEQDMAQAASWYRKAAEQGDAIAENNLGWMYENGKGVKKDQAQAIKWYRKAARDGDEDATKNLARLGISD